MIRVKVPELLEKYGKTPTDLMRHANIAYATAHKLATGKVTTGIRWDVLEKLCIFFDCEVGDILEYVQD